MKLALPLVLCLMPSAAAQTRGVTRNPHGPLSVSCEACHTSSGWTPIRPHPEFNHNTQTAYPLMGMHAGVSCGQCHVNPVFKKTAHDCASCHADLHRAQMGVNCAACHSVQGWTPVRTAVTGQHSNRFPLLGAHATTPCESCHRGAANAVFVGMSTECLSCHRADFVNAQSPPHQAGSFPTDCSVCHTMNSWLGAKFDHTAVAHFALTGVHATLACAACHIGGKFAGTPAACVACHQADLQSATNPNHLAGGFSTDCSLCHNTTSWAQANFDHNAISGFALTGAHATATCAQCHTGSFANAPRACAGCHMTDYNQTTNPNHAQAAFPTDCSLCHSTVNWSGATFDHSKTAFPLTGAHTSVACAQCHVNNNYTNLPSNCDACHRTEYNQTTNPNHAAAGFPLNCAVCHTTVNWTSATFDHNAVSGFPLTGAHATVTCAQCHTGGSFANAPRACAGCHMTDYNQTTNPNHAQAAFPTDCSLCHSTVAWTGASFDHSKTAFPLTGAHTSVACAQCHVNNNYTNLPSNCDACHRTEYNQTSNPNHVAAGFPLNCAVCHSTTNWTSATFDHSKTVFPLTGAHVTVPCASCHIANNYTTVPTDCYSCHKSDYTGVQNPNHVASGFPTTCATCHTTSTWAGATFNHTWFPIYSGTHNQGVWTTCGDCHLDSSNYAAFSCINCHTHNQAATDPIHRNVRGYSYTATACYQCHPQGRGGR